MKQLILLIMLIVSANVLASANVFEFETPADEKRFQELVAKLRCPTCQNQNLADSNSMVAEDLKQIVYEKIVAGESDENIILFMKQRYGEFILYQPELSQSNMLLWAGPFIFLVLALGGFFFWFQSNKGVNEGD